MFQILRCFEASRCELWPVGAKCAEARLARLFRVRGTTNFFRSEFDLK